MSPRLAEVEAHDDTVDALERGGGDGPGAGGPAGDGAAAAGAVRVESGGWSPSTAGSAPSWSGLREAEAGLPEAARVAGQRSGRGSPGARPGADEADAVERYAERVREWAEANHGAADPGPFPAPEREDYQELYRTARQHVHAHPPPPRRLRKHWRRQLWVARACLEREGGRAAVSTTFTVAIRCTSAAARTASASAWTRQTPRVTSRGSPCGGRSRTGTAPTGRGKTRDVCPACGELNEEACDRPPEAAGLALPAPPRQAGHLAPHAALLLPAPRLPGTPGPGRPPGRR